MSTSPAMPDKPSSSAAGRVGHWTTSSSRMAAVPPSYPPTEVQRWLTCPVFRDYSARWVPRLEAWTPHKTLGTAIHAGIAAALRPLIGLSTCPALPASDARNGAVEIAVERLRAGYVQQETWGLAGLEALVTKGTKALIASVTEHLLPGAQVVTVEYADPAPRPVGVKVARTVDCVLQRDNVLEVWDWKTHMNLSDTYLPDTLAEAHHAWQLLDYAWHAQQWFGKSVGRVGHGHLILGPKVKVEYSSMSVAQERLKQWEHDAVAIWSGMWLQAQGRGPMWHNWKACSDKHLHYGKRCSMWEACHTFYGNEALFPALYRLIDEGSDALQDAH